MAFLKCKMCGGDFSVSTNQTYGTCDSCGSTMTLPKASDEQRANLFNRANHFRRLNEFDKAINAYERILNEDDTDAEAHWGVVLSRYGIEYVEDPLTHERVPTCRRVQAESILSDADYLAALEHAGDSYTRSLYEAEAKCIADIQRGILAISRREEPYDVFICYKETNAPGARTKDSTLAQDVYYQLTNEGLKVFFSRITLEDKLGQQYEPFIFAALNSAKVMIVIGTMPEHFNAVWVKNEWSRYLALMKQDRGRLLIPCYRDMDPYDLPEELSMLQSQDMSKIGFIQDLIRGVKKVTDAAKKPAAVGERAAEMPTGGSADIKSILKRAFMFLEDGNFVRANEYFERVLDGDPECAEAYLGLAMTGYHIGDKDTFQKYCVSNNCIDNKNLQKAKRFAKGSLLSELLQWGKAWEDMEKARQERERELRLEQKRAITAVQHSVSVGLGYIVGLKSDGTVLAEGSNTLGECRVDGWRDIVAVSAGRSHTVGLKSDGTVLAEGSNRLGQCRVDGWRDIVAVSAGYEHTVGLKTDGTVAVAGSNEQGQCNVNGWRDIVKASAGNYHTVGLKSDGTVVAAGDNTDGQCSINGWRDIVAVSAGGRHTVGLKLDGTVMAEGLDVYGQCKVGSWCNIVAVSAGGLHTVGLKSDGTVVATGKKDACKVDGWNDIVAVSAGDQHTVGIKSDGTIVAVGSNKNDERDVSGWRLFRSLDTLESERKEAIEAQKAASKAAEEAQRKKQERIAKLQARISELKKEREKVTDELAKITGLFAGKERKPFNDRLAEIDAEINRLTNNL